MTKQIAALASLIFTVCPLENIYQKQFWFWQIYYYSVISESNWKIGSVISRDNFWFMTLSLFNLRSECLSSSLLLHDTHLINLNSVSENLNITQGKRRLNFGLIFFSVVLKPYENTHMNSYIYIKM